MFGKQVQVIPPTPLSLFSTPPNSSYHSYLLFNCLSLSLFFTNCNGLLQHFRAFILFSPPKPLFPPLFSPTPSILLHSLFSLSLHLFPLHSPSHSSPLSPTSYFCIFPSRRRNRRRTFRHWRWRTWMWRRRRSGGQGSQQTRGAAGSDGGPEAGGEITGGFSGGD